MFTLDSAEVSPDVRHDSGAVDDGDDGGSILGLGQTQSSTVQHGVQLCPELPVKL